MAEAAKQFLIKLADLVEEYAAEFYYTNNDDGIHILVKDGPDCFIGHSLEPNELRKAATSNDKGEQTPACGRSARTPGCAAGGDE